MDRVEELDLDGNPQVEVDSDRNVIAFVIDDGENYTKWFEWIDDRPTIGKYARKDDRKTSTKPLIQIPLKKLIKKIKIEEGYKILYQNKPFNRDDLIKHLGIDIGSGYLKQALDFLPFDMEGFTIPSIKIKSGILYLTEPDKVISDNPYSKEIAQRIKIEEITTDYDFKELLDTLTPKQLGVMCAIVGALFWNIIKTEYNLAGHKLYIALLGHTNTGKTTSVQAILFILFGLDFRQPISGKDIESAFRIESLISSTNLPVLIDDALIIEKLLDIIRAQSEGGSGHRGMKDLGLKKYENLATLIITSNDIEIKGEMYKEEANRKRFIRYVFEGSEEIPEGERGKLLNLLNNLKGGGYLINKLKSKNIEELYKLWQELYKETNNVKLTAQKFGARILEIEDRNILFASDDIGESWKELVYSYIKSKSNPYSEYEASQGRNTIMIAVEEGSKYAYINSVFVNQMAKDIKKDIKLSGLRELATITGQEPDNIYPKGKGYSIWINRNTYNCAKILLGSAEPH